MNVRAIAFFLAAGNATLPSVAHAEDVYALYFSEQDKTAGAVVYPCLQTSDIPEPFLNGKFKIDREGRSISEATEIFTKFPRMLILLTSASCVDQIRDELVSLGHDPATFDFAPTP